MAIIRWDPFREMVTLREKMNRLFEDAASYQREDRDMVSGTWAPAVDLYETETQIVLTAEVPGIEDKDIEVKLEDCTLPNYVDQEQIKAEHEHGVLKVFLPKKLESKTRSVTILKPEQM